MGLRFRSLGSFVNTRILVMRWMIADGTIRYWRAALKYSFKLYEMEFILIDRIYTGKVRMEMDRRGQRTKD